MPGTAADRQHERVTVNLSAEVTAPRYAFTASTLDLSVGGAALECELPLNEGENVRLALFFVFEGIEDERTPPLVVGARVQWTGENDDGAFTAGVRFDEITDAQKQWLSRVLATQGTKVAGQG
jgi:hypothetical protein